MALKTPVYLVEKSTGLLDKNHVELFYTVAVRLARGPAEIEFKKELQAGNVRIRKLIATK